MGIFIAKIGGTYIQVSERNVSIRRKSLIKSQLGMGSAEVTVPITLLLVKEFAVLGSFRYGESGCCANSGGKR